MHLDSLQVLVGEKHLSDPAKLVSGDFFLPLQEMVDWTVHQPREDSDTTGFSMIFHDKPSISGTSIYGNLRMARFADAFCAKVLILDPMRFEFTEMMGSFQSHCPLMLPWQ